MAGTSSRRGPDCEDLMTDPDAAQRAREWLEHQLADLGELRNASRRDQHFKTWRQQTLTVIQRIWPGEPRRVDRFRRIPFSTPIAHATDRQVREFYERGWGEAGVLLREFIAEVNLLGLLPIPSAGTSTGAEDREAAQPPMPSLTVHAGPKAPMPAPPEPEVGHMSPPDATAGDDIGRAMERLLSSSPVFRGTWIAPAAPVPRGPEPGSPAALLMELAGELEALGLPPARVSAARETLLALAHAVQTDLPPWDLVADALAQAGASPALAHRVLPLLLPFVERAA
jgi:hypothetical protein